MWLFSEWLIQRSLLLENNLLVEFSDYGVVKKQINQWFNDSLQELLDTGKISVPEHRDQATNMIADGFDWWSHLVNRMRVFPYKGNDLYDAATQLAGDLWEKVYKSDKYRDERPPEVIFKRMAYLVGRHIAFGFFGWRNKLKTCNGDYIEPTDSYNPDSDMEWEEIQKILMHSVVSTARLLSNKERAERAVDVMRIKLNGRSKIKNKIVANDGLDRLSDFYGVNRREMYETLLVVYRAARDAAKELSSCEGGSDILKRVMAELPQGMQQEPKELILKAMPSCPSEISHSDLFVKVYSKNRELKAVNFRQAVGDLIDNGAIQSRKDDHIGKHQRLYRLTSEV